MGIRLLAFVALCGAFASTGRTAAASADSNMERTQHRRSVRPALSNARLRAATLEKLPLPRRRPARVPFVDRLQILVEDTQGPSRCSPTCPPTTRRARQARPAC